jgi:hypothetical protein
MMPIDLDEPLAPLPAVPVCAACSWPGCRCVAAGCDWCGGGHLVYDCPAGERERGCTTVPAPGGYLFPCSPGCDCRSLTVLLVGVDVHAALAFLPDGEASPVCVTFARCVVQGDDVRLPLARWRADVRGLVWLSTAAPVPQEGAVLA